MSGFDVALRCLETGMGQPVAVSPNAQPADPKSPPVNQLATQAEFLDQRLVARAVLAIEIIEQAAALGDESQKTTAGMVILFVVLEMVRQVLDAFGKDGHLDFRRTGIALGRGEFAHQFLFAFSSNRHRTFPLCLRKRGAHSRDVVQQGSVKQRDMARCCGAYSAVSPEKPAAFARRLYSHFFHLKNPTRPSATAARNSKANG